MSDFSKVEASLREAGFQPEDVAAILNGANQIKEKGDKAVKDEGIRKKTFDQAEAAQTIAALTEQFQNLQSQLAALELTRTAQKALDAAAESAPQQEVYTLEDIKEVVQKAVAEAITPFIEGQKQEANATVTLWDQVSQLNQVAQTAQKSLQELTGELPRALQQRAPTRYVQPQTEGAGPPPIVPQGGGDNPFSWVDEYMQTGV